MPDTGREHSRRRWLGLSLSLCLLAPAVAQAEATDVLPRQAAIASAHPLATRAGLDILAQGGNAFDAAVTVSAVLAVVEPYSSGMGGGGFWLLHRQRDGRQVMLDGRERAPLAAHRDLYLDADGEVIPGLSVDGPLAAGIPGQPAALAHLAEHYGQLPLAQTLAPAITLARDGFPVDAIYRRLAGFRLAALQASPAAAKQFLQDGEVPPEGHLIRQPDLARVLERMAVSGAEGFYAGETAAALVRGVREAGGIWSAEDLATYRVVERAPVVGHYGNYRLISAAPPSSGGVVLVQILNMLQGYALETLNTADRLHFIVEAMRRAYRDRARYLGDPDQVELPLRRLLNPEYALGVSSDIRLDCHTPSAQLGQPAAPATACAAGPAAEGEVQEGTDTTHFSIIDRQGNRVAATLSINYPFGAGFVPPGTGILLNDEMDDFSAKPGVPNVYGLVGAEANAIAPGKRMLSSMSPTFIEGPERVAILGTPGGSRIISMVLLAALEFIDGKGPEAWVSRPRYHHQYLPDRISFEPDALSPEIQRALAAKGHRLQPLDATYGNLQGVMWSRRSGEVSAASDPRGLGLAATE